MGNHFRSQWPSPSFGSRAGKLWIACCILIAAISLMTTSCSNSGNNDLASKTGGASTASVSRAGGSSKGNHANSDTRKRHVEEAVQHVTAIMKNLKNLHEHIEAYSGLTTSKAINAGVFPDSMVQKSAGKVENIWGGSVQVEFNKDNSVYILGYSGVPTWACYQLATSVGVPITNVSINLQSLSANSSRSDLEGKCAGPGSGKGKGNLLLWAGGYYK